MGNYDEEALAAAQAPLPDEEPAEAPVPDADDANGQEGETPEQEGGEGDDGGDSGGGKEQEQKPQALSVTAEQALRMEIDGLRQAMQSILRASTPDPGALPNPNDPAKYPLGEMDSRYIADLAAYERRTDAVQQSQQVAKAHQEAMASAYQAELKAKWQVQEAAGKQKYGDEFSRAIQEFDALRPTHAIVEAIAVNDNGTDVTMYLRAHPNEVVALSGMRPAQVNQYIAVLGERLASAQQKKRRAVTKAAKPPAPVGGRETPQKKLDAMSFEEYRAYRSKKRA